MLDFNKLGLAVFDMDSTLITIECIDEIAALIGHKEQVSSITERAMRGELDFAQSLKQRVALLTGVTREQLRTIFEPIPYTPGAKALIAWLHQRGWKTAVVSGGFTWFTEQVQNELKLTFGQANILNWKDSKLTGQVDEPIVDAQTKAQCLLRWAMELGIPNHQTLAV